MKHHALCLQNLQYLCYTPYWGENSPWLILFSNVFDRGFMNDCLWGTQNRAGVSSYHSVTYRKSSFFLVADVMKGKYSACTWIGETAAAGAVRMGIPLSGLLAEEGIWTVWLGPSERADNKTPADYHTELRSIKPNYSIHSDTSEQMLLTRGLQCLKSAAEYETLSRP